MKQLQLLTNANFDLMGKKFFFLAVSTVAVAISLFFLLTKGLNMGVDFRGGTEIRLKFLAEPPVEEIRSKVEALNVGDVNVQRIGKPEDHEVVVQVGQAKLGASEGGLVGSSDMTQRILSALGSEEDKQQEAAGKFDLNRASAASLEVYLTGRMEAAKAAGGATTGSASEARSVAEKVMAARDSQGGIFRSMDEVSKVSSLSPEFLTMLREGTYVGHMAPRSVEFVGPSAGRDLIRKATLAVIGSNLGILLYIWFRYRFIWGVAGVVALIHDVIMALGGLALSQKEFSLPVVAALLTIVGYSINDTVVVFDRIRENLRHHRTADFEFLVNASINQTFSRTVLTVFTVLLCTTTLFLFGGDRLNALSFTLLVGFLSGAYSSVFVACPILVLHQRWWNRRRGRTT